MVNIIISLCQFPLMNSVLAVMVASSFSSEEVDEEVQIMEET